MTNPLETRSKTTQENIAKLKEKLRELFQLDRGDLDFGLYRIMAIKSKVVGDFLEKDLLPQVTEALGDIAKSDQTVLNTELDRVEGNVREAGVPPEKSPKIQQIKAQIKSAKSDQQTEADTYNHLCNFFSRYYDEGDFMSLRRYKGAGNEAYSIPYNGEEVKLHWANADQYYIKTTENYASYIFTLGANGTQRICFEIAGANNEKDNIKESNGKQRFFVLAEEFIVEEKNKMIIRFDHRPLTEGEKIKYPKNGSKPQSTINQDSEQRIFTKLKTPWANLLTVLCPTEKDESRTLLGKHITTYTAKNSFDYFIHKDLGGFLRRELDSYLKSEVISIDNLELADDPVVFIRSLAQIKAIKVVGNKIIDFLAQLENFQKQLWLKKKFVLETQYCVTLDKVPQSLYAEIIKNKAQHEEWVKLFAIDEINGDIISSAYSKKLKPEFLKDYPYLVLDTRHFDQTFTDKLLAALSDKESIDEQLNGLLIHGDNFQALNLLQEQYHQKIKLIHIDPPYNTDTSGFIYKNNYQHSSWLTMMENRIACSLKMLEKDESFLCHIDENEYQKLYLLFNSFPIDDAGTIIWDKKNPVPGGGGIAVQHEYIIWRSNTTNPIYEHASKNYSSILAKANALLKKHKCVTDKMRNEFKDWINSNKQLSGGDTAYSFIDDDGRVYLSVSLRAPEPRTDPKFFKPLIHPVTKKPCVVPPNGFSRTPQTLQKMIDNGEIIFGNDHTTQPRQKRYLTSDDRKQTSSVKYSAKRGKGDIDKLKVGSFPYCHSVDFYADLFNSASYADGTVLDYFAGSGTTGHAVINLNREDKGNRKYILVELGHHFEDVLLPRMKKVIYSSDWKEGKPKTRDGISQLIKYVRIESYEDTLDGLTVQSRDDLFAEVKEKKFAEDYQLHYALGEETAQSATLVGKDFIDPFNYTLSVVRDGTRRDVKVDLAETFNFLLGLRLATRQQIENVLTITGTNSKGDSCLILWRDLNKINASKLDKWFNKHRKTFGGDLNCIYVNGDHTLNALKKPIEKWEAVTIEPVFRELMFEGAE